MAGDSMTFDLDEPGGILKPFAGEPKLGGLEALCATINRPLIENMHSITTK